MTPEFRVCHPEMTLPIAWWIFSSSLLWRRQSWHDVDGDERDDDDDDDDDSDDYDDLDDTLLDEVMNLEKKVETSKGRDYGAHAKLLLKLRQAKLKERLEESRVAFDRKFSLSEEQWLSWLEDKMTELKKCASGKKRKEIEVDMCWY